MARIVITTFGSTGDLNPFVALGLGLKARGHEVVFAVEDIFKPIVEAAGLGPAQHLTGNSATALAPYSKELYTKASPVSSVKIIINQYVVPTLEAKLAELRAICAGADLIVAPTQQYAAAAVSELTGIPWATVALIPASLPSAYVEPTPLPFKLPAPAQRLLNRALWELGMATLRPIVDKPINAIRAKYGLPPRRNLLNNGNLSSWLTAIATSPAFTPPQPDWPSQVKVTGFCFWDTPADWTESAELSAFLDGARPVVAVSSGSTSPDVKEVFDRFFRVSLEAIRQAGARALVIGAAPGTLPGTLPGEVLALPFAPFSQIYPRCAAIIHHGGIGTTAQGLRAGVPALVVPWGADQFYTAAQVARAGAGNWLSRRAYTPEKAGRIIQALIKPGSEYKNQAGLLAAKIAREDGVENLCQELEKLLAATPTQN